MTDLQPPHEWIKNNSINQINFDPRPIIEDISVVIPTLGRDILEQSLYRIAIGNAWPACLIIVNQGPDEKVGGWLQHLHSTGMKTKHIRSNQRGRSVGVNRGLEQVETTFVAITDDDCFVGADWLRNMSSKLKQNPGSIVTGRVEAAGEDMLIVVTSTVPAIYYKPRLKFDSMSGGNMGTSISVVKKVGLFEEDPCMQTAEDAELSYRALRKGISIIYDPEICLWHYGWRDPEKRFEQYRHYALSHGGFYGKYIRRGDIFILVRAALHLLRALRRWINGLRAGNADLASIGRAYFLYLVPGIMEGIRSDAQPGKLV